MRFSKIYCRIVSFVILLILCGLVSAKDSPNGIRNIMKRGKIIIALPNVNHSIFF